MPIYEYRCSSCGFQKEYLRKVSDPLLSLCPECGKDSFKKMLTAAGFQLKGTGWYATDFKAPVKAKTEESKTGNGEAKADTAKSETAKSDTSKSETAKPSTSSPPSPAAAS